MRIRRRLPPRVIQHTPLSSPSKASQKRARSFPCVTISLMFSLACAWSLGALYFLNAANMKAQSIPNAGSVNSSNSNSMSKSNNLSIPTHQATHLRKSNPTTNSDTTHFQLQSTSIWSWPIIHIISTRFMQGQGHLLSLGRSRLKLLETICLPSIRKQTILYKDILESVYNHTQWSSKVSRLDEYALRDLQGVDPLFLWVIKVDPELDETLLKELNSVLEPVKRFTIVVGSNTNYGIGIKAGGWRDGQYGQNILEAFENNQVYFPADREYAYDVVSRAHAARLDRVVLETRLDADDAINISYFSVLQYTALKDLVDYKVSGFVSSDDEFEQTTDDRVQIDNTQNGQAKWIYWCPHRHVQWNPSTSFYNPNNDPGMLSVFESPNVCVTPGLTLGFAVGTDELEVPRYEHTQVYWEINHGNFQTGDSSQHDCGLIPSSRCAVFVENPYVSAFRSRAMTSAGKCKCKRS